MRTVLVVDDDPVILRVVATVLDLEDYDVVTCLSADEAMDQVGTHVPDIVVADVMMPDVDGFELTRWLRGDPRTAKVPVILLTARDSDDDRVSGRDAGSDAYLTKPFSPLELLSEIERLLARRGPRPT